MVLWTNCFFLHLKYFFFLDETVHYHFDMYSALQILEHVSTISWLKCLVWKWHADIIGKPSFNTVCFYFSRIIKAKSRKWLSQQNLWCYGDYLASEKIPVPKSEFYHVLWENCAERILLHMSEGLLRSVEKFWWMCDPWES